VVPRRALWRRLFGQASIAGLSGLVVVLIFGLGALAAPMLTSSDPTVQDLAHVLEEPSTAYPLGTDDLGRDVLSRLLHGGRVTLTIALVAATSGFIAGLCFGLTAGYFGGRWDTLVMRTMDVILAFPGILLALTFVSILGFGIGNIIAAIGVVSIPVFARMARATTLSVQSMEYISAAKTIGAPHSRVLLRHLLPNILAPIVTLWTLRLGTSILTASGLGFLGLGVQPPTPEWGTMLSNARSYMQLAPHLVVLPGMAITLAVLGFALMGDWLRDVMDPRTRAG
jgi:peptide/nickel transport system permease protein